MKIQKPTSKQIEAALRKIAEMGSGIPQNMLDWHNIGKNAVALAKETLRGKCSECGR